MNLNNLVKYYQQCYQEDVQGTLITNIFAKSIQKVYFFEEKEEIITGFLPYAAIDDKYGEETAKKISLSEKEQELVYCSIFIAGKGENNEKICSPLFIYPAEIIKIEDDYFVKIDNEHRRINYGILNEIISSETDDNSFVEEIYKIVNDEFIDLSKLNLIGKLLTKISDEFDTSELLTFPELMSKRKVQAQFQSKIITEQKKIKLLPASAIAMIRKSVNTRGILNELAEISKSDNFSLPLRTIFGNEAFTKSAGDKISLLLPAILNREQENIIRRTSKFPFSVIIGPPGTGKSFTISVLAIEKMIQGKSVLITSGTDKAVDIIADKIEKQLQLNNVIVRGGRKEYKKEMIEYIEKVLRISPDDDVATKPSSLAKELVALNRRISNLEKIFGKKVEKEIKNGKFYHNYGHKKGFFINLKKKIIRKRTEKNTKLFEIQSQLFDLYDEKMQKNREYLQQDYQKTLYKLVSRYRSQVKQLLKALKSRRGTKQEEYFSKLDFSTIFTLFPIWLVKMSDIYKILPLIPELFDYVIIDEATQCNISQAIPVIQRAKKLIITGDPKQLRHFSFLSAAKQQIFRDKLALNDADDYLLDYKRNSLLDIVMMSTESGEQFTTLYEHYRSLPAIIRFSNRYFYENKLRIMTSKPGIDKNKGLSFVYCEGQRDKNGVNVIEAEKLLEVLRQIIKDESQLDEKHCSSIGILSPLRSQVEYLAKKVTNEFSLTEIQKHNIAINTAYGFQGDERDIMLISFAVDKNSHPSAYRYINKDDVFNVSITRARKMQYVFYSVKLAEMKTDNLLRKYLEQEVNYPQNEEKAVNDRFVKEVETELQKNNYQTWTAFEIAGQTIDLVIKKDDKIIGIDLIGYPGVFEDAFSTERYKMLARAGVKIFPLEYSYWLNFKQQALTAIEKMFNYL